MRTDETATGPEYVLSDGELLVSRTDLDSRITYANPAFSRVSGFARDELIGQPHNIVRHPDMPKAAFADLWKTVRAGIPWSGLVKNRRKGGGYYWVCANVTPVMEHGRPTGYVSVRTPATPAQTREAEALYAAMRDGTGRGTRVDRGWVVRGGLASLGQRLAGAAVGARLAAWTAALGIAATGLLLAIESSQLQGPVRLALLCAVQLAPLIAVALWARSRLVGPLRQAVRVASALAAGNLDARLPTARRDEVGLLARALGQVSLNIQATVDEVVNRSREVAQATREIASGNQDLSARTEQQAATLQQTAASMERITHTVRQNADSAAQADRLVQAASGCAARGSEVVGRVASTMNDISASSGQIADITGLIDGIAFQTNILALNAAVEAARAGEQGRGFAVVASEVRTLARRSGDAARQIKGLIDASVGRIEAGFRLASDAEAAMGEISQSVDRAAGLVAEISSACGEQSSGIGQVSSAIGQMDRVTQQNAALVEQAAAAAASLDDQATRLTDAVAVFRVA